MAPGGLIDTAEHRRGRWETKPTNDENTLYIAESDPIPVDYVFLNHTSFLCESMQEEFKAARLGLFATPVRIQSHVSNLYGQETLGVVDGVKNRFYAISTGRKLKHPTVLGIGEHSRW